MSRHALILLLAVLSTGGCKKTKETIPDSAPPPPATPKPASDGNSGGSGGISPAGGVGVVMNPSAALGGGGGGGAVMSSLKAGRRTQALNEMKTLGEVISLLQNDLGRMPTKDQILQALKAYPKLQEAVNEGAFILTGTTEAGGLWAYEVGADTQPGIALIGGVATRSTPDDLRQYFQNK